MKGRVPSRALAALALALVCACSSSSASSAGGDSPSAPHVTIVQTSQAPDARVMAMDIGNRPAAGIGLPVYYRLEITNPFDYPVRLVSVQIESVGQSGAYSMKRLRHNFDRTIAAGASDTVAFRAWVQPSQVDMQGDMSNPVMLRGSARFESEAGSMRRNFVSRAQ